MIKIIKKENCSGCMACGQICPKKCIEYVEDEQGFIYPKCDESHCINCGLCEKVCPIINKWEKKEPIKIIACKNKNEEERYNSSSGGTFILLSKAVIRNNGVVFGASYDENWMVKHSYTEHEDGLSTFQGSKYVQSSIGDSFIRAKEFLDAGRQVLFSGTPCQVAGLKHFLKREYDNLLTVEVLCHGVPSPMVWRDYLNEIQRPKETALGRYPVLSSNHDNPLIESITFRDKKNGWRKYDFVIRFTSSNNEIRELYSNNVYMKGFLNNLTLRPSCFHCSSKGGRSKADLSLGDFWTINQHCASFDDNKGVTLVYIGSEKGKVILDRLDVDVKVLDNEHQYNAMYTESTVKKYPCVDFWERYKKDGLQSINSIDKSMQKPLIERVLYKLRRITKK